MSYLHNKPQLGCKCMLCSAARAKKPRYRWQRKRGDIGALGGFWLVRTRLHEAHTGAIPWCLTTRETSRATQRWIDATFNMLPKVFTP